MLFKGKSSIRAHIHALMHILSDVKGGDLSSKPSAVILGLRNNKESLFIVSKLNYISEMPSFQSFLHSFPPLLQRSSGRIICLLAWLEFPQTREFLARLFLKKKKALHNINSITQKTKWRRRKKKENKNNGRKGRNNDKHQILNEPIKTLYQWLPNEWSHSLVFNHIYVRLEVIFRKITWNLSISFILCQRTSLFPVSCVLMLRFW